MFVSTYNSIRDKNASHVMEYLIDKARHLDMLFPLKYGRETYFAKPGEIVQSLTDKEREILKTLVVKDFDHRLDVAVWGFEGSGGYKSRYSQALKTQYDAECIAYEKTLKKA